MSLTRITLGVATIAAAALLTAALAEAQAPAGAQAQAAPKAKASAAAAATAAQGQAPAAQAPAAGRRAAMRVAPRAQRLLAARRAAGAPWAQLNLTEAQRDQLKGIQEQHAKDAQAVRERLRAARQQLAEAMRADVPDEGAVRAAAESVAAAQAEQRVLQARLKGQRMKVLTPEQVQQLKDAQARAAERRERVFERQERAAARWRARR